MKVRQDAIGWQVDFTWKYHKSEIRQTMCLYEENPRIDFKTEVDWQERQKLLKTSFPVDVRAVDARFDIQDGNIRRPITRNTSWEAAKFEVAAHKWVDLWETGYGMAVLNDCKYGHDIKEDTIRLTLLKSAVEPDYTADLGTHSFTYAILKALSEAYDFDLNTPYEELPEEIRHMLMHGTDGRVVKVKYRGQRGVGVYDVAFEGVIKNVQRRYRECGSERMKKEYESFMRITPCAECGGKRLKSEALAVTVGDKNIAEVTELSISKLMDFMQGLELTPHQLAIGKLVLREIKARLQFLLDVGLEYLTLARATGSLSGGEAQRIRLATQIGSGLVGVAYILDEPSIGLHQRDNDKLLGALMHLRDLGNSLIVVEHDEDTMRAADCIVDIGPGAGEHGGQLVGMGTAEELMQNPKSITGAYLSGKLKIPVPEVRKEPTGYLTIKGAAENNLKHIDVDIPLGIMTCITGVSGSGKSSLINEILYKHLARDLNRARVIPGKHDEIIGIDQLDKVIAIDQSPIGRTPRSNPATYTGVFDQIRDLFAATADAKAKGYKKGRF